MKKSMKNKIAGVLIVSLLVMALALFMAILIKTQLLPTKILLLAGGIFLLYALCVFFLTRNSRRIGAMVCGCMMTMILLIVLMLGTPYLMRTIETLDSITKVDVEIADVGVYVKKDSTVTKLEDLSNGTVGVMAVLDRENTDQALAELQETTGNVTVQEYDGLAELIDSVLEEDVDAIVANSAYLDLLSEMEGYEDAADQLREIHAVQAESTIENVEDASKNEEEWNFLDIFNGEEESQEEAATGDNNVFTVYISGIDSHGSLKAKGRSDVNIIATINVDTRQVLLISTPRDFYVPLSISNGVPDKLTHAGIYGIDVSIGTLEMLYDTEIDYYFRVNFSGFEKIIDALGGVTVHSDYSFKAGGYSFSKGSNTMNGAKALAFARERKSFASGDRQRGKNQMAVIKAVIEKAMSPKLLKNYADIMASVSGSFETSMSYDKIAELVRTQLDQGGSWKVVSYSVTGSDASKKPYSLSTKAYVMIPNQETVDTAIAKINQVKNGEILE